jgi:hypothetical protein
VLKRFVKLVILVGNELDVVQILDALLEILSFATSHYAINMQLVVVYNYFGHVCNYNLVLYNFWAI